MSLRSIHRIILKEIEDIHSNSDSLSQNIQAQIEQQTYIIQETNSFCPFNLTQGRITSAEDVEEVLNKEYDDMNALKAIMCTNNNLVAFPPNSGVNQTYKIRRYLRNLSQIGNDSAEGYAMSADVSGKYEDGKELFVVKFPQNKKDNLLHEYFVGAFGTNTLRDIIPNFAYILGFFFCSPPYIGSNVGLDFSSGQKNGERIALTYCQNNDPKNQVSHILYENISPSQTLYDFIINGASFKDYLNVLIQVILALNEAYTSIDFTHYDLHTENVLVRELPEEIYIPYTVNENGLVNYLKTKYLAVIIDFGRSHIMYRGEHFGFLGASIGTYSDKSYPMGDIYRLIVVSLRDAFIGNSKFEIHDYMTDEHFRRNKNIVNPKIFDKLRLLISYFAPETDPYKYVQYIVGAGENYYTLPYISKYDISSLKFFQESVLLNYPGEIKQILTSKVPDESRLYGCAYRGTCKTLQMAMSNYSEDSINIIADPYIFYQTFIELESSEVSENGVNDSKARILALQIYGRSRYQHYMTRLLIDREIEVIALNELLSRLYPISLSYVDMNNDHINIYQAYINKLVQIIDYSTTIVSIGDIIRYLNILYPREATEKIPNKSYSYSELISQEYNSLAPLISHINNLITDVHRDIENLPIDTLHYYPISDKNRNWLQGDFLLLKYAIHKLPTPNHLYF